MNCPRDRQALVAQTRHGVEIDLCPACSGVWLDAHELAELVGSWQDLPRAQPAPMEEHLQCPRGCGPMRSRSYSELHRVVVDQCEHCRGIWLDGPELTSILSEVYSYRSRSGLG